MSGSFDTQWLDLREPADHAARDATLASDAARHLLAGGPAPLGVDLGSGTGSTVRALAPLAPGARWRLVDNDPRLLAAAVSRLSAVPRVERVEADLRHLPPALLDDARLVTASALFDLASRPFVDALADRLAAQGTALYAALNYDGRMRWDPAHPDDRALVDGFNRHQRGDKGFGPALGPAAAEALREAFERRGYRVRLAPSPWRLGPGEAALGRMLRDGFLDAVAQTGAVEPERLQRWRAAREGDGASCEVGHVDVLALPPAAR